MSEQQMTADQAIGILRSPGVVLLPDDAHAIADILHALAARNVELDEDNFTLSVARNNLLDRIAELEKENADCQAMIAEARLMGSDSIFPRPRISGGRSHEDTALH